MKITCAGNLYGDLTVLSGFSGSGLALRVLRQADAMIAISSEVERELIEIWGFPAERVVRLPNGVDTGYLRRSRPFPERGKVWFALIGRRHPQKGVDLVLEAAAILKQRGLESRFEVKFYGLDYPECDYREMSKSLGVANLVEFLLHQEDMLDVLHSIRCFLLPSRGEGLSNALLEAMSMELPLIVTPVSGIVDAVEDGKDGITIPLGSSEALAGPWRRS